MSSPNASTITPEVRALLFQYDKALPLEAVEKAEQEEDGVCRLHIAFTSIRGQRVLGSMWLPASGGPHPVIVLQHGAGHSRGMPYIAGNGARWAREGYAVAAIDAYGHGERAGLPGGPVGSSRLVLPWRRYEHAVQMAVDLMRTLDYLASRSDTDVKRVGFVGFSMGTIMGVAFVALDPRVKAAAFCIGGSRLAGPWDETEPGADAHRLVNDLVDPTHFASLVAPRPVLMINGRQDAVVAPASGQTLFDAFKEPKQIIWYDGGHEDMRGPELKQLWAFLRTHV